MKVYLDYSASTPVLPEVVEVMKPYWTEKYGNPSSIHSFGQEARIAVEEARTGVAKILNCEPDEIYFTSSATTALNLSILGYVRRCVGEKWEASREVRDSGSEKRPHLITTKIEHHGVLDTFKRLEREGFEVTYLEVDKYGIANPEDVAKAIRPETILVSIMYANNEVGTIQPISTIHEKIEDRIKNTAQEIVFHSDAVATSGYLDLDVQKLGLDMMVLGAHKFGGPKGVGILYTKKGIKVDPITFGGHHEGGLWPGTESVPLIVGAAKALGLAQFKVQSAKFKVMELRDKLTKGVLERVPGAILTGHPTERLPELASFCFPDAEGEAILLRLDGEGIAVSSGSACTSGSLAPSHVLLAIGIPAEVAHGSIRFSLGRETTEEEIDYVLEKLPPIVEQIRVMAPKL